MNDLGKVAGGVFGGEDGKFRARSWRYAVHSSRDLKVWQGVNFEPDALAGPDEADLRFFEVRGHVDRAHRNHRHQTLTRLHELAHPHREIADAAGLAGAQQGRFNRKVGCFQLSASSVRLRLGLADLLEQGPPASGRGSHRRLRSGEFGPRLPRLRLILV